MSKTIHIHIHRGPAKDAWEEGKHKRADNGQFGSGGGGGAAKPAAKSAPAAKPAIAVKQANRGAGALAQLQAQSNAHLKKTGFGHLVTPPKNAPGSNGGAKPITANERKEPNQVRSDVIATINKRLDGPLTAQSKKELLEKKARLVAAQKAETAKPAASKSPEAQAAKPAAPKASASPEMARKVTEELNAALKNAGSYEEKVKLEQAAVKSLVKAGFSPDDFSEAPTKTQQLPSGVPEGVAAAIRNSNGVRSVKKTEAGVEIEIDHHNGYGSNSLTLRPDGSLVSSTSGPQSGSARKLAGPGEGEAALIKTIGTQAKKTPPSFLPGPKGSELVPGRRTKFSWS